MVMDFARASGYILLTVVPSQHQQISTCCTYIHTYSLIGKLKTHTEPKTHNIDQLAYLTFIIRLHRTWLALVVFLF